MHTEVPASLTLGSADDLPQIYADMEQQLPSDEMHPYKSFLQLFHRSKYKVLLYRRDTDGALVGFALVYTIESCNILWLDYLEILKEYRSQGYGKALFHALSHKYCGPFDGILFPVEHVHSENLSLALRQKEVISFCERLGAHRLHADFQLPCREGSMPMYLYFKPRRGLCSISRSVQIQAIGQMYEYCFFYLKQRRELFARFKQTILDEKFLPIRHPELQRAAGPAVQSARRA